MSYGFFRTTCCHVNGAIMMCPPAGFVSVAGVLTDAVPGTFDPETFYLVGPVPDPGGPMADHANEYTWFQTNGSSWQFCVPNDGDKLSIAGTCAIGCWDADEEEWVYDGISGLVYTGANLGPAVPIFEQVTPGGEFQFHTLLAGTNITLVPQLDGSIRINSSPGVGSGEVNAGFNVGGGVGVYRNKTGVLLNFKSLISTNPALTIVGTANTIEFGITFPPPPVPIVYYGVNLPDTEGGAMPIFVGNVLNQLQFNQWRLVSDDLNALSASVLGGAVQLLYTPWASSVATFGDMFGLYNNVIVQGSIIHWNNVNGGWEGGDIAMNNVGTGVDVFRDSDLTTPLLQYNFRKLLAGANMSVGIVGDDIVFSAAAAAYTGLNLGAGNQVFSGIVGSQFQFRTLVMGTNMSAVQTANEIAISTTAELNSAANVGGGTAVYTSKVGPVFQLRTFGSSPFISVNVASDLITFTPNPADFIQNDSDPAGEALVIDSVGAPYLGGTQAPFFLRKLDGINGVAAALAGEVLTFSSTVTGVNVGGAVGVWKDKLANGNLRFFSLLAGTNITLSMVGDTIKIDSTGLGGGVGNTIIVEYAKTSGTTTIDTTGDFVPIVFDSTVTSHANVSIVGDEITFNVAGQAMISAKGTTSPGSGRVQTKIRVMVDTGGGWTDLTNSHGYGNSPNDFEVDHQTAHTGNFSLTVGIGNKIRVELGMSMGTLEATILNDATGITILLIS